MSNESRYPLTFDATRDDIIHLRRVLAWASKNKERAEARLEQRQQDCMEPALDLQAEIAIKMKVLRASKDVHFYDGIYQTVRGLLGVWRTDQPELFEGIEELDDGETERRAGSEGEDDRAQSPVSEQRAVPSQGEDADEDV